MYVQNLITSSVLSVAGRRLAPKGQRGDIQALYKATDANRHDVKSMVSKNWLRVLSEAQYRELMEERSAPAPTPKPAPKPAPKPVAKATPAPKPEPPPAAVPEEAPADDILFEEVEAKTLSEFKALSDTVAMRDYIKELGISDDVDMRGKKSMLRDYKAWLEKK